MLACNWPNKITQCEGDKHQSSCKDGSDVALLAEFILACGDESSYIVHYCTLHGF